MGRTLLQALPEKKRKKSKHENSNGKPVLFQKKWSKLYKWQIFKLAFVRDF